MKNNLLFAIGFSALTIFSGCSSAAVQKDATEEVQEEKEYLLPVMEDSGYRNLSDEYMVSAQLFAEVSNPNEEFVLSSVSCSYLVRNKDNKIVKQGSIHIPQILPGESVTGVETVTFAYSDPSKTNVKDYTYEITLDEKDIYGYFPSEEEAEALENLSMENLKTGTGYDSPTVQFDLTNNNDFTLQGVNVDIQFLKDGKIVDIQSEVLSEMLPHETYLVTPDLYWRDPETYDSVEVQFSIGMFMNEVEYININPSEEQES